MARLGVRFEPDGKGRVAAQCPLPGHEDHNPSFKLYTRPGGGWYCYGQCDCGGDAVDFVAHYLGLDKKFDFLQILTILGIRDGQAPKLPRVTQRPIPIGERTPAQLGTPAEIYHYREAGGAVRYEVLRYQLADGKKTFRQRRPNPRGGVIWDVKNVEPLLYRLPELLAAPPDATAWICAGEKDANRVAGLGLVATTNSGGEGNWPEAMNVHLAGRAVVILADNDAKGRQHAADVAASLHGIAQSVKVLALPGLVEHGDVSDFLDGLAGRPAPVQAAMLEMAAMMAPLWQPTPTPDPETGLIEDAGGEGVYEALAAMRAEMEAEIAALQQQIGQLAAQSEERQQLYKFMRDVMRIPNVPAGTRCATPFVTFQARQRLAAGDVAPDGYVRLSMQALAISMSAKELSEKELKNKANSLTRNVDDMVALGWIESRPGWGEIDGHGIELRYIKLSPALQEMRATALPFPAEKNPREKRDLCCPQCKSTKAKQLIHFLCENGHVFDENGMLLMPAPVKDAPEEVAPVIPQIVERKHDQLDPGRDRTMYADLWNDAEPSAVDDAWYGSQVARNGHTNGNGNGNGHKERALAAANRLGIVVLGEDTVPSAPLIGQPPPTAPAKPHQCPCCQRAGRDPGGDFHWYLFRSGGMWLCSCHYGPDG